jgi:hypothetical protein
MITKFRSSNNGTDIYDHQIFCSRPNKNIQHKLYNLIEADLYVKASVSLIIIFFKILVGYSIMLPV